MRPLYLIAALILANLVAGCATPAIADPSIARPHEGFWARYQYPDGLLEMRLLGPGQARDAWGTVHETLVVKYTIIPDPGMGPVHDERLRTSGSSMTYTVTEHLDAYGRIVRHETDCSYSSGKICDPERRFVTFAPTGHAGGLGVAPYWSDGGLLSPAQDDVPRGMQTYAVPGANWDRMETRDCWSRVPKDGKMWETFFAWHPVTAIAKPLVACKGIPVPVDFVADMAFQRGHPESSIAQFRLVEWKDGDGTPWPTVGQKTSARATTGLERNTYGPAYLADERPYARFSSLEAHQFLLEANATYAALADRPDAAVIYTTHSASSNTARGPYGVMSKEHEWFLRVADAQGNAVAFQVELTDFFGPTGIVIRTEMHETPLTLPEGFNFRPPLTAPALSIVDAIERATATLGCGEKSFGWRERFDSGGITGFHPATHDGRLWAPVSMKTGTQGIDFPYHVASDGTTGAIVQIQGSPQHIEAYDERGIEQVSTCEVG